MLETRGLWVGSPHSTLVSPSGTGNSVLGKADVGKHCGRCQCWQYTWGERLSANVREVSSTLAPNGWPSSAQGVLEPLQHAVHGESRPSGIC